MFALRTLSVAAAAVALPLTASAQNGFDLYNGSSDAGLFTAEPAGFTFLDFGPDNNQIAVTDTGSSFVINANADLDGANGIFGGVGRDLLNGVNEVDPASNQVAVEYRFLSGDTAGSFNLVLADVDPAGEEQYQFGFGAADFSDAGDGFTMALFDIDAAAAQFSQTTEGTGDGAANYGLRQWQIQSGFGSTATLNVEIRRVAVVGDAIEVPEPASLALLGLGATALLGRRRSA